MAESKIAPSVKNVIQNPSGVIRICAPYSFFILLYKLVLEWYFILNTFYLEKKEDNYYLMVLGIQNYTLGSACHKKS